MTPDILFLTYERFGPDTTDVNPQERSQLVFRLGEPNPIDEVVPPGQIPRFFGEGAALDVLLMLGQLWTSAHGRPTHFIARGRPAVYIPLWGLLSRGWTGPISRNYDSPPDDLACVVFTGPDYRPIDIMGAFLGFSALHETLWGEPSNEVLEENVRTVLTDRSANERGRIGHMFGSRLYSHGKVGQRQHAFMTSLTMPPTVHATFVGGEFGYMRLGHVLEADARMGPYSTLPIGYMNMPFGQGETAEWFDMDEATGLVATANRKWGRVNRGILRVFATADQDMGALLQAFSCEQA